VLIVLVWAGRPGKVRLLMARTTKTPYFKEMTNEGLIESYLSLKALAYNGAAMKSPRLGTLLRHLDIVIAISRKRGLKLSA
jgi:hypothetical protein